MKIDPTPAIPVNTLNFSLAPSFGPEEHLGKHLVKLEERLKALIAGAVSAISGLLEDQRSLENVIACFKRSPLMVADGDAIYKSDTMTKVFSQWFKGNGDVDPGVKTEVSP